MAKLTNAFSIIVTAALSVSVAISAHAAIPVRWTADCYKVKPLVYECYHGETLDLAAEMTAYGEPLDFTGKTARLYWQTNGMESAWWSTNAAVRADAGATNVLAAVWSGAYDTGADAVSGFIGIEGENYRAAFTLRFRASPGFAPASLPVPTRTIDWANVQNANAESAPFVVKGGAGGVTLAQVTNVANARIDAKVAPWAMRGQPQPTGSITNVFTNGVSAVAGGVARIAIPSTNGLASAGDVAAATNGLPAWTKAATKPSYTASEVGALPAEDEGGGDYSVRTTGIIGFFANEFKIGYGIGHYTVDIGYDNDLNSALIKEDGRRWYYGEDRGELISDANEIATLGDLPTPETPAFTNAFASKATEGRVTVISNRLDELTGYITGERVRLSITNYYGNTSGEPPRLRIEEFDHSTTSVVANVAVISNFYRIVWDEVTRQTNYMQRTDAKVDAISNNVMTAAFRQTNNQLANKAPRAWQTVTSAGEQAPPNVVWHTAPNTVFAGGTEYAHVAVGEGVICVLVDNGAPVYTEGAEGQFKFKDESGQNYFGFDVRQSYTIGCRTDGISVSPQNIVSLTYDLTSADNPEVLVCTNLAQGVWTTATVEWEQSPPVGTKICYINGTVNGGFYKAQMNYAGGAKFITNMMAELAGGIAATNETGIGTATHLPIYPAITSTGVVWRVNWGN